VTEVPEHLLRRGAERRAALAGGGEGAPAAPSEAPGTAVQASAADTSGEEIVPAAAPPAEAPPVPVPPYVAAAMRRPRVPKFAIPVLAALPVWALVYAGAMASPPQSLDPELAQGQAIYAANCSSCHGADGGGGTGRPLGQVLLTFPDKADHIAWIHNGSPEPGTPYGDPNRPGGQRIAGSNGYTTRMPAFKTSLSDAEIAAVARYEREVIGKGAAQPSTDADLHPGNGGSASGSGSKTTTATGSSGGSTTTTAGK
jgi:mono/diheme cytochrome c family protein